MSDFYDADDCYEDYDDFDGDDFADDIHDDYGFDEDSYGSHAEPEEKDGYDGIGWQEIAFLGAMA